MDKLKIKSLELLNIFLDENKQEIFDNYARIFLKKNSRLNLISKNDEKFLFEKHIFDSLAINLFRGKCDLGSTILPLPLIEGVGRGNEKQTLLDIGAGGGFPSVPIAILYEHINVYPLDSIRKKINAIEEIKNELNLKNLFPICDRVENITQKFDYVSTRAVAPLKTVLKYTIPLLKKGGYFIAYKSKKASDELKDAESIIKSSGIKLIDIIEYTLPLEEIYERNLVIFKK